MHKSVDGAGARAPVARYAPDRRLAWSALAGALVLAVVTAGYADAAGRLLTGIATLVLALTGVADLLIVPRLTATPAGLVVRTPTGRTEFGWEDVDRLAVDERSRLGRASRTLEIEAGDRLIVLGPHSLGADPRDVLPVVSAFRPDGA